MSVTSPLISICIPAYKRPLYLKRLLDSISEQTFRDYEIVITDDSGVDNSVENMIKTYNFSGPLIYIRNEKPLGSPVNWIESIKYATGQWIKIMHDDDYFSSSDSLQSFVNGIESNIDCIFSGYTAVHEEGKKVDMTVMQFKFNYFLKNPFILFSNNLIGPPSVLMFNRKVKEKFDSRLKWIVDWEFYIRLANNYNSKYISNPLICVSYNDSQITNLVKGDPAIEISEAMIFFNKYNYDILKIIPVYDAWWRLIRNLKINSIEDFMSHYSGTVPVFISNIILFQSHFGYKFLKIGIFSKTLMFFSYLSFRFRS